MASISAKLSRFARPYIVRELPGWGRLMKALQIDGINNVNPKWRDAPTVTVRGKRHGYLMELDLSDDLERCTYFLGRYYDLELQTLLGALLRPGDTFLDIGANIGMMTLHAAKLVGSEGKIIAFEPQPSCVRKLERQLELNNIHHVTVHNIGLADQAAEMVMSVPRGGSIMAHIGATVVFSDEQIKIPVRRGDDLVAAVSGRLVIKIDVEGYEVQALRGLGKTIALNRPAIISELNAHHLQRAGKTEQEAIAFFTDRDYVGYAISTKRNRPLSPPQMTLTKLESDIRPLVGNDFLWLPREGPPLIT